ncbi:MAG: hypothetical protein DDT27_01468 [Dehalococcoidia bacterium]|nr:hypothetical protein [Chloroflexota bacterium]MBT9162903.1 hypothetical protein [Chloroflexota bacterium]
MQRLPVLSGREAARAFEKGTLFMTTIREVT